MSATVRVLACVFCLLLFSPMPPPARAAEDPAVTHAVQLAALPPPHEAPGVTPGASTAPDSVRASPPAERPPAQPRPSAAEPQGRTAAGSAYVTDHDLGNGRHLAIVSPTPVNYLAADGSWQPIVPRFQAVPGGFLNETNSLVVGASERQAAIRLRWGDAVALWEAKTLAARSSDGSETVLARPLRAGEAPAGRLAAGGAAIRYDDGWSLSGLHEEITVGSGRVEHSLIVDERPEAPGDAPAAIAFQAVLRLLPGERLAAGGVLRSEAFTTDGAIEIFGADGQAALALAPAAAFEQANPAARVAASYRAAPFGADAWLVAIETPWAWWANADRRYPVVIDPLMWELMALEVAEIRSVPGCPTPPVPPVAGDYLGQVVGVGTTTTCGAVRTLLRFKQLPALPPGSEITRATLSAIPTRGQYLVMDPPNSPYPPLQMGAMAEVSLYRVLDGQAWDAATVNWSNQPAIDPDPLVDYQFGEKAVWLRAHAPEEWQKSGGSPHNYASAWVLQTGKTGLVTEWLKGNNAGLLLRAVDETPCTGSGYGYWEPRPCQFVAMQVGNLWTDAEKGDMHYLPYLPDATYGGFLLGIEYAAPQLTAGAPVIHWDPLSLPDPEGDLYFRSFHAYRRPAHTGWLAVGVKGLDEVIVGPKTYYKAAGGLGIGHWSGQPIQVLSTGAYAARPNYLVYPPGEAVSGETEVLAPDPADPANATLDTYAVEAAVATDLPGSPTFSANTFLQHSLQFSSTHILRVLNLNLAENTRIGIEVSGHGARGLLFPPADPTTVLPRDQGRSADPYLEIGAGQGGAWALVIEYPGDVAAPDFGSSPFNVEVDVDIRACGLNAVPTANGCEVVNCPVATDCHVSGPYRICSEAGFDAGPAPGEYTSRMVDPEGDPYATCIGWQGGATDRWVAVNSEPVHFTESGSLLEGSPNSIVSLGLFSGANPVSLLPLWQNAFEGHPNPGDSLYGLLTPDPPAGANYSRLPLDDPADLAQTMLYVDVQQETAHGRAFLDREIEIGPGELGVFAFRLDWQVRAEGYAATLQSGVTTLSGPGEARISSLTLRFGAPWAIDWDPTLNVPTGMFTVLRSPGKIVQPEGLGGAWRPVQAAILPRGKGLPDPSGESPCSARYCWEPRAPDDAAGHLSREWQMPDVEVTGSAQTVTYTEPGQVVIYSADHPKAVSDVGVPFSYRFLDARVTASREPCQGLPGEEPTTVLRGQSKIVLPGIGNGTDPPLMDAAFKLCETSLREVHMTLDLTKAPGPGLPVGSTGAFVDSVSGDITVAPDHTTITFGIHYKAGAAAELLNSDTCNVTVDTRGLFDMSTTGTVLHTTHYDGHVWVAWNPLDVGADIHLDYNFWVITFDGRVNAHAWKGQGWQNRYWWLPPDDAMHMTGSYKARMVLKEGSILSCDYCVSIPPSPVTLSSVTLAFGEFCGKDCGCQCFEWGFKAVFSDWYTLWQDIGFYYGVDSGLDFVLGSDGYKLVDQGGGAGAAGSPAAPRLTSAGRPLDLAREAVADPLAEEVLVPLTMTAWTGSALVGLGWENAKPSAVLTLIRPDAVEITPANAHAYGVSVHENSAGRMYGLRNPQAGVWQAKIADAAADDYWHLTFFANKKMPQVVISTPATANEPWDTTQKFPIRWDVPGGIPPGVDVRASFFYTVTQAGALTPTQQYGGEIARNVPLSAHVYEWDLSWLGAGRYQVYARIETGGSDPYLPRPSPTGTNQLPGVLTVTAPGSLLVTDPTIPHVPQHLEWVDLKEGAKVCWDVVPDHDLSGYVVAYRAPDVDGVPRDHTLRVHATEAYAAGARQCARIGGLNAGTQVVVKVRSYDASNNLSAYGEALTRTVSGTADSEAPSPGALQVTLGTDRRVILRWTPEPRRVRPSFLVYYAADALAGPGQPGTGAEEGNSPVNAGTATEMVLHGLAPGRKYTFAVRAYDGAGRWSAMSNLAALWLTDGRDGDGDRMPDDWEQAQGVLRPEDDPDGDCVTNLREYGALTYPHKADSDGDGFLDGEEIAAESDPADAHSLPPLSARWPRLALESDRLTFRTGTANTEPLEGRVRIWNPGSGNLEAVSDRPWLRGEIVDGQLRVTAYRSRLTRGHYTGTLTITGAPGVCLQAGPHTVTVDLILYQGQLAAGHKCYLPVVLRSR